MPAAREMAVEESPLGPPGGPNPANRDRRKLVRSVGSPRRGTPRAKSGEQAMEVVINRSVKGSNKVARKALGAAGSHSVTLPAQEVASGIVAELAAEVLTLKGRVQSIDEEIRQRFFARPEARILSSHAGHGADPRGRVRGLCGRHLRLLRERREARRLLGGPRSGGP